ADTLTYTVSGFPASVTVYPSGLWTGTPMSSGTSTITVTANDSQGGTTTQFYVLSIVSSLNHPPAITSQAVTTAVTGTAYSYAVTAKDSDSGQTLSYALSTSYTGGGGPTINSSTGVVSWAAPVAGTYTFTVTVSDSFTPAAKAYQTYTLTVRGDSAPTITNWSPATSVVMGTSYRYDVKASDVDNTPQNPDPLTYTLTNPAQTGPNNNVMTIDQNGRITWTPQTVDIGKVFNNITVQVTDSYGISVTQTFGLTVSNDTVAPTVELQITPGTTVNTGTKVTFLVFGSDNVGVASLSLTVAGTNVPLDSKGQAVMIMNTAGSNSISASAKDAAGNVSTAATATLVVQNPTGTPPTVSVTAPAANAI